MAISYPRTLPSTPGIKSNRFGLVFNIDTMTSPISKQANHDIKAGHRWEGMYTFPPISSSQARVWKAWFATMYGPAKTFYAFDPDVRSPNGTASTGSDTPLVKGASQTGNSITTDGWRTSSSGLLLPGDPAQIGGELKIITEQVDSDGSGNATVNFMPELHVSPGDDTAIVFDNPVGTFTIEGLSVDWESDQFGVHDFAFAFVEKF